MPVFNYAKKEVNLKIVYYGPGLSGKTTNLQAIHDGIKPDFKGKLVSLATQTDRTLFFDFMPLELGTLGGFRVRLHLYTVPGQVHYNATRKLVLKGVDGIIFVADSLEVRREKNMLSLKDLQQNLKDYGMSIFKIPMILQYNKRDLEEQGIPIMPLEKMERELNSQLKVPSFPASAISGDGVGKSLTEGLKRTLKHLQKELQWAG